MPNQQEDPQTNITVSGSGALATGHSVASGERGVAIGGHVFGDLVLSSQPHPVPPPYQVPLLPLQYVRRPTEEARLKAALLRDKSKEKKGTTSILAIEGMGGIGKSTLIAAVARDEKVVNYFEDGILWATLGRDVNVPDKQDSWAIALGGDALGYDLKQVHDKQSKTELLRTLLHDKVCLLVIDDAWKSTDVEALCVGGEGCCTVITTRSSKVTDSDAVPFHLDVMELEEAKKLLREWAGAKLERKDPKLVTELAKRLGCLPLALRLAGRQIRRDVGLQEVLDYFRREQGVGLSELDFEDPETKQESLEIAFDLSLAYLDGSIQKHYKQLGVFAAEADFDVAAAAAVWEIEESLARRILRRLNGEALLDLSKKNTDQPAWSDNVYNVYRLHILLRDYTRAKLDNNEMRTAANRHLDHYWNICRKLALKQMPDEGAPLEQVYAAYCHAVEIQDLRAIDLASMIGAFPPEKRIDARLRPGPRLYESGLTRVSIPGVGTVPPATEVPDPLAATIVDDVVNSRPVVSFVWRSGGHMDAEPT